MFRLWRSEAHIQERLDAFLTQIGRSLRGLQEVFPRCLDGTLAAGEDLENPVHRLESAADDMRRELEKELLGGKLLPESRAEVLALVEEVDRFSNLAETIVDYFSIQRVAVPESLRPALHDLLRTSIRACDETMEAVRLIFADLGRVQERAATVDHLESEADAIERRLVREIFGLEVELARKLHLRDLVATVAGLADQAENAADHAAWLALKRKP